MLKKICLLLFLPVFLVGCQRENPDLSFTEKDFALTFSYRDGQTLFQGEIYSEKEGFRVLFTDPPTLSGAVMTKKGELWQGSYPGLGQVFYGKVPSLDHLYRTLFVPRNAEKEPLPQSTLYRKKGESWEVKTEKHIPTSIVYRRGKEERVLFVKAGRML